MNKKILIAAIVIIVAAGGWYLYSRGGVNVPGVGITGAQSLRDLLTAGGNTKCSFTDADSKTEGTFYVSGGKVRGDFNTSQSGKPMMAHMIVENNNSFMWIDGTKDGFKTSFDATKQENTNAAANEQFDASRKMDYHCGPWGFDAGEFVLPPDVKFNDFSGMMKPPTAGGPNTGTIANVPGAGGNSCATCDTLPEAYKAQCKTALGCK